jgi:hypothetical protein
LAEFCRFRLPEIPGSASYAECMADAFQGELEFLTDAHGNTVAAGESHNWKSELDSLRRVQERPGKDAPPALSVWQAAGYKHAQMILANNELKGCLYWWTPGSGKSVMVALLIELLKSDRKKVVVVSTPQNIRENGREECIKSILRFSPRHCKGANHSDADKSALLGTLEPKLLMKDFCTFRQFYTQYQGKDMSQVCLIIDESHELFNDKLKNREEIYQLISRAQRVFLLSGDHSPRM